MHRSFITTLILALLMILSGCGQMPLGSGATATPQPSATPTPHLLQEAMPTSASGKPRLVVWTTEQGAAYDQIRALIQGFTDPQGWDALVVSRTPDDILTDLVAADVTGDSIPDAIWGDQNDLAQLLKAERLQAAGTVGDFTTVLPAALDGARANGQIWGYPLTLQGFLLLFANTTINPSVPHTTDELIVQSRNAKHDDQFGILMGWTEARWFLAWLNGFGGDPLSPDGARPVLDTPQMVQTINLLRELVQTTPPDTWAYDSANSAFASGKTAFIIDGDWALDGYHALSSTLQITVAALPIVPATNQPVSSAFSSSYLMIPHATALEAAGRARALAAWLMAPEQQRRFPPALRRLPVIRGELESQAVRDDPVLAAAAQQAKNGSGIAPTLAMRCAIQGIRSQFERMFTTSDDVAEIAKAMQQRADECMQPAP